ncbi:unnamed protein product, partial [Mesorhabditis belari]|uniref:Uncharacterized protein n=1 Tax=Mesorhabditis belari TaxID=2138241 RepID=A0AAF3FD82_9BILA
MAFSRELTPLWVCKTSEMDRTIAGICGNVTESFGDCNKGASIAKCTAMEYEKRCNLTNAPQLLSKYTQMFAETKIPEFTQCSDVIIKALLEE